ncbi:hypothetical protein THRCLA_21067 [Thraustotheca clavata]|uniref:Uncharacterized protein n=1 Tax=Thraustotheca clavata TaxID=74557 RepID=A0A1W0A0F9_9STRA|nr:hypothetical protein THRCLA_21067 [Thraustotheca clavata]
MELMPKSSSRYAPSPFRLKTKSIITPYSGLGQLPSEDDDSESDRKEDTPQQDRLLAELPRVSNNNQDTETPRSSTSTELYDPPRTTTLSPEVIITLRRKVIYEAKVRLQTDKPAVYVGRYKSENAARDACEKLIQKTKS